MLDQERKRLEKQERGGARTKRGRGKKVASYNEDLLAAAGAESSGGSDSDSDASACGSRPFFEDSDSGYSDRVDESSDDDEVSVVFCISSLVIHTHLLSTPGALLLVLFVPAALRQPLRRQLRLRVR
jgi:hypothetical protein